MNATLRMLLVGGIVALVAVLVGLTYNLYFDV
jgi:hypothetical protein